MVLNPYGVWRDEPGPQGHPLRNAIPHASRLEFWMLKWLGCTAIAALFAIVQAGPGLAQSAPPAEKAETAAPAEKTADKPAVDKAAAEKPAAEKPAAAERSTADKAADKPADKEAVRSPTKPAAGKPAADKAAARDDEKPKKKNKMTRQQELDHSVDTGTVPARYRSQVPKEYHQYIPFAKQ
jgi:hypothetical protein